MCATSRSAGAFPSSSVRSMAAVAVPPESVRKRAVRTPGTCEIAIENFVASRSVRSGPARTSTCSRGSAGVTAAGGGASGTGQAGGAARGSRSASLTFLRNGSTSCSASASRRARRSRDSVWRRMSASRSCASPERRDKTSSTRAARAWTRCSAASRTRVAVSRAAATTRLASPRASDSRARAPAAAAGVPQRMGGRAPRAGDRLLRRARGLGHRLVGLSPSALGDLIGDTLRVQEHAGDLALALLVGGDALLHAGQAVLRGCQALSGGIQLLFELLRPGARLAQRGFETGDPRLRARDLLPRGGGDPGERLPDFFRVHPEEPAGETLRGDVLRAQ